MFGAFDANTFLLLVALAVGMWLLQFALVHRQMRQFYTRLKQLRRVGLTAIGKGGGRVRGRAYAVLVVDDINRIVAAEALYGWTVFSGLRPVPALVGMSLSALLEPEPSLPLPQKLLDAFGHAARSITEARQPKSSSTVTDAGLVEA